VVPQVASHPTSSTPFFVVDIFCGIWKQDSETSQFLLYALFIFAILFGYCEVETDILKILGASKTLVLVV
jgi:hypothetical protein